MIRHGGFFVNVCIRAGQIANLRSWHLLVESLSGLFDKVCQSMILRWALFHSLFNVDVDPIHKLTFGQVDFLCYPRRPVNWVHNVRQGDVTWLHQQEKEGKTELLYSTTSTLITVKVVLPLRTTRAPLEWA